MSITWLIILIIYGNVAGWQSIQPLFWLLLIPFIIQDSYDVRKKLENN